MVALSALYWLWVGWSALLGGRRIPRLGGVAPLPDDRLPSLTVVAAARNEADHVERAARSLLAQDYPQARVLVVDDRSTDATGAILDRLAAENPRLGVLHIESLPEGWIGKCHALERAAETADTDWILFTDGDVTLALEAARRAVSLAVAGGYDHVAVGPAIHIESLGEAVFVGLFIVIFNATQRPWLASDPRSRSAIGIGAFNLVRREAYVRAGGHASLRYELLDDMTLGKLLKQRGARQVFARHDGLLHVRWHHGVGGLIRGVEKNAFPAARYSVPLVVVAIMVHMVLAWAPVAGLFLPGALPRIFALAAWAGAFVAYHEASRGAEIRTWQALLMPVGMTLFLYSMARSTAVTLAQGGVRWRDTFYPLETLKRGRVW